MTDWGWIAFGYVTVYGVLLAYAAFLIRRVSRSRRDDAAQPESGG